MLDAPGRAFLRTLFAVSMSGKPCEVDFGLTSCLYDILFARQTRHLGASANLCFNDIGAWLSSCRPFTVGPFGERIRCHPLFGAELAVSHASEPY